jgi:plasmid stability protein
VIAAMERGATYMCDVNKHLKDDLEMPDAKDELVVDAVEDVPAVLLFHLLGKRINTALSSSSTSVMTSATNGAAIAPTRGRSTGQPIEPKLLRSPAAVWGISEEEYERQILSAFSVAEERARRVALAYKSDLERLNRELLISAAGEEPNGEAKLWIKALALAVQARTGVAVAVTGA